MRFSPRRANGKARGRREHIERGDMSGYDDRCRKETTTTEIDGKSLGVSIRIVFDGIEHVGRLWFAEEGWDDDGIPDRGAFPGRTREEVIALGKRLSPPELAQRYRRAQAQKLSFHTLP